MRRIAVINQKGGVGKTTTTANLGAALAQQDRRVVVVDMDAQANLSLSLNVEAGSDDPSTYTVLTGATGFAQALRPTSLPGLSLMPSNIDLSGAELELASAIGREYLMKDALAQWESEARTRDGRAPADYVIFDCPPSLGLLSINALAAAGEVLITLQTEFLALQGMSKLVEVVQLLRRRLNPELVITGILPCLYDSRLKLAREVLGEIRAYFPGQVFPNPVRSNVKLAEAPSYGKTIFEYAPDSNGAADYRLVAREVIAREARDPDLAHLPPFRDVAALAATNVAALEPRKRAFGRTLEAEDAVTPAVEPDPAEPERAVPSAMGEIAAEPTSGAISAARESGPSPSIDPGRSRGESSVASTETDAPSRALPSAADGNASFALRTRPEASALDVLVCDVDTPSPHGRAAHAVSEEASPALATLDAEPARVEDACTHGYASSANGVVPAESVEPAPATVLALEAAAEGAFDADVEEPSVLDDEAAPVSSAAIEHERLDLERDRIEAAAVRGADSAPNPIEGTGTYDCDSTRSELETIDAAHAEPLPVSSAARDLDALDPEPAHALDETGEAAQSSVALPSAAAQLSEARPDEGSSITDEELDTGVREPASANASADESETVVAADETLRDVVLTPPRVETPKTERRILRAEDLPPLPPDAFEILTSYVHER